MKRLVFLVFLFSGLAISQSVTVWTHFEGPDLQWLQTEAASFEDIFGVTVTITSLSLGEIKQKILVEESKDKLADLFLPISHSDIGPMVSSDLVANMNTYATQSYLEDLSEQARLAFTINGSLFGLPMYVEGPALIINTNLVPQSPNTFEDLIETAKSLTSSSSYGFLYDIGNFYFSYTWLSVYGGYIFAKDPEGNFNPQNIGLANADTIKGGSIIQDFRYKHGLIPRGINYALASDLFFKGQLAMTYDGPWAITNYQLANLNFIVKPLPPTQDGNSFSGFMSVNGLLINNATQNQVNTINLAKWLTRPDAQVALAEFTSKIPTSKSAISNIGARNPIVAGFAEALGSSTPIPNIPEMGKVWGPMDKALKIILESPQSDVTEALQKAIEEISK